MFSLWIARVSKRASNLARGTVAAMPSPFVELEVGERVVKVTNPDKVFFRARGETKLDLVHYYLAVGEGIVRALRERPTQLKRHPRRRRGRGDLPEARAREAARLDRGRARHLPLRPPRRRALRDRDRAGRVGGEPRTSSTSIPGRRAAATSTSRTSCGSTSTRSRAPSSPTRSRSPRSCARCWRDGLTGWPKTSGNRGIHVACRIEPRWELPGRAPLRARLRPRGRAPAPELVTTAWWKEERGEQVFIDYNQNARDRTIASAYSVRAGPTQPSPRR